MCTVDVVVREGGKVVAVLRGELDVAYAASVAAGLAVIASRDHEVIVDLAGLEFMDDAASRAGRSSPGRAPVTSPAVLLGAS